MSDNDKTTPSAGSSGRVRPSVTPASGTSAGTGTSGDPFGAASSAGNNPDMAARERSRTAESTSSSGSDTGSRIRETAAGAGEKLKARAFEEAEHRKNDAAESMQAFADTIRSAADDLSQRDQSAAARVVQEAARGLESLSRTIHDRSVVDASRSMADYGRRHPFAVVAGGLLAGLAIGRFLKASGEHQYDDDYYERRHSDTAHAYGATGSRSDYRAGGQSSTGTGTSRPDPGHPASAHPSTTRSTAVLGENDGNL